MNYSDLTKTQKRCIDAFIKLRPELNSQATITRPEVESLFQTLFEARATGGEKIGYPMWLVKGDKLGRGIYEFPAPELDDTPAIPTLEKTSKSKAKAEKQVEVEKEDKEFFTELAENGIMESA
jgi:hypothetical protein